MVRVTAVLNYVILLILYDDKILQQSPRRTAADVFDVVLFFLGVASKWEGLSRLWVGLMIEQSCSICSSSV